jgi:sarcosine oxidase delta subunit
MTCPYCGGRGLVDVASVYTYAGERRYPELEELTCPWCEGTGGEEGEDDA